MTKAHTHNIGLAIWRLKFFYETFVQGPTAVILLNFCAKNRHIAKPQTVTSNFTKTPMNTRNLILFVVTIFMLFSCKSKTEKPKAEYNQKANELIEQLISEGNCECILEIPEESMIEFDTLESPNFEYENYYIKKLSLKNKKELDSLNNLSKKFVLDTKILKRSNIKIIKRDSLRILNKDINFYTKTCKNLKYLIKPIFNKEFNIAIIDYGDSGMCLKAQKQIFEYENEKWNRK